MLVASRNGLPGLRFLHQAASYRKSTSMSMKRLESPKLVDAIVAYRIARNALVDAIAEESPDRPVVYRRRVFSLERIGLNGYRLRDSAGVRLCRSPGPNAPASTPQP